MKEKIPFYNVANMFFVGCVFCLYTLILVYDRIPLDVLKNIGEILTNWTVVVSVFFLVSMFEIGFIINRLGSIIVEPLLVILRVWPREKYDVCVSQISQENAKFQSMITELNIMRSHIMICLLMFATAICLCRCYFALFMFGLILVFCIGGRKHNAKINIIKKAYAGRGEI